MPTQELSIDITAGLKQLLGSRKKLYPQHVNRISALDDPCLRRLYYMRHDWREATPIDDGLQGIFETGTILEPVIERIVLEVGMASNPRWRIVGSQTPTDDSLLKKYQISGTIDGFLQVEIDGKWVTLGVVDIKTMSPNIFPAINDYRSLNRYPWTRRYRGQLMLYALAHNLDRCFILLVNKTNLYSMKIIDFPLDMEYCERLLNKAQAVNEAIETETPPDGINDPDECPRCRFYSFCHPDLTTGGNLIVSDNEDFEAVLERLAELKPTAKEYADLEKTRDSMLVQGQDVACGRWIITWKKVIAEYKAREARNVEQWRKKIFCSAK